MQSTTFTSDSYIASKYTLRNGSYGATELNLDAPRIQLCGSVIQELTPIKKQKENFILYVCFNNMLVVNNYNFFPVNTYANVTRNCKMKKYKHIFFDLDNTLWDFDKNSAETLHELFHKHNLLSSVPMTLSEHGALLTFVATPPAPHRQYTLL